MSQMVVEMMVFGCGAFLFIQIVRLVGLLLVELFQCLVKVVGTVVVISVLIGMFANVEPFLNLIR